MVRNQEDKSPHLQDCLQKLFGCLLDLNKKTHMIVLIHLLGWSFHWFLSYFQTWTSPFLPGEPDVFFQVEAKAAVLFADLSREQRKRVQRKGKEITYITIDTHTQAEHIYLSVHNPINTLPAPDTRCRQCWCTEVQCWFLRCLHLEACWIPSPAPAPHAAARRCIRHPCQGKWWEKRQRYLPRNATESRNGAEESWKPWNCWWMLWSESEGQGEPLHKRKMNVSRLVKSFPLIPLFQEVCLVSVPLVLLAGHTEHWHRPAAVPGRGKGP